MVKKEVFVPDITPQRNDLVLAYRLFEDQMFIVDLVHGTLNALNITGTRIWQLIEENKSAKEIANKLTKEFDVSFREAANDVVEIIKNMVSMGWVKNFPCEKQYSVNHNEGEKLFELLREETMQKKVPLVVHFDLTYRCPLQCVHCYLMKNNKHQELTLNEIKNILDQLADAGTLYLTFSGGEIFLRDDLPEIVTYARKLHFAVRLLASGVLIDKEMACKVASWYPEMVAFSIYDMDASIHDAITRKKGSLAKTLAAIEALKEKSVPLKISSVLMKKNVGHYYGIYDFAKELGAQFQADYRITPKTNGSKEPLKFHIKDQKIKEILSDPIFSRNYELEPTEGYSGIFDTVPCGAGHMSCYITPYGMITPCVQVPIEYGNLKEKLFSEIWNNSPELKAFRKITFSDIPKCVNCKLFAYCRPCPGLNLVETGNITTPPQRMCKEAEYMKTLNKKRR